MKYRYMVKANGQYYPAGAEVPSPAKNKNEDASEQQKEPVKQRRGRPPQNKE